MENVDYSKLGVAPEEYRCCNCNVSNVKLWREYQTIHPLLFCASCAAINQHTSIADIDANGKRTDDLGARTDQIGNLVPAVPDEEGVGYWGYSSVPQAGVDWWRSLPTTQ